MVGVEPSGATAPTFASTKTAGYTILYSTVKKSGKTTINGALTLWWAFTQEAPNEILVLANDLEQSLARVFNTMEGIIDHNPELKQDCEVRSKKHLH